LKLYLLFRVLRSGGIANRYAASTIRVVANNNKIPFSRLNHVHGVFSIAGRPVPFA
jgi:hypothetical protein